MAGARHERRLLAVACRPLLAGDVYGSGVPIGMCGYFFGLSSNSVIIFATGSATQVFLVSLDSVKSFHR